MKKGLWMGALAVAAVLIPMIVRAAENTSKKDEVVVTTTLETVR